MRVLIALATFLLLPLHLAAQTPPPALTGTVVDASGGVVSGAVVTLQTTAAELRTTTDSAGRFSFDSVAGRRATVTATFDGFAPAAVVVEAGRTDLRLVLQPASAAEDVMVTGIPNRIRSATKTDTLIRDVQQAISVVDRDTMSDLNMTGMGDVVRYVPGVGYAQGEGNRDTPVFRGNSSTSDFFVDGVRDDVQYYRDVYNVDRVEVLKGPNAMIFGRGGVGGVINRVQRAADWMPVQEIALQGGSFDNRRITGDVGRGLNGSTAARLTGVYEKSDSYRDGVGLERYGLNPTMAFALGPKTIVRAGYEYFHDERTADRGIPSFGGRPIDVDRSTFFGNASQSDSVATVNLVSGFVEHRFSPRVTLRNRLSYGDYDKFYQNVFPGAVNAAGTTVSISGYNNATDRKNLFNQADLTIAAQTGRFSHTVLTGVELGRQETDNFRNTGYFTSIGPTTTSVSVPVTSPATALPISFRQSATDADNHGVATVVGLYAQDQVEISRQVQAVVGVRFDAFGVDFRNNRSGQELSSDDRAVSPRVGVVYKPVEPVSFYSSYSVSYLPRAGEQLASLSPTTQALDPETFRNYEVGAKWDFAPGASLSLAVYHLQRGNVAVADPNDPTVSILVDGQRTRGFELGASGSLTRAWSLLGAYAYQNGEITRSLSANAPAGAALANLPKHSFSLWNRYDLTRLVGVGLGVVYRDDIFTSTDNTVVLPDYVRADAAAYVRLTSRFALQLNVENVFNRRYYVFAHNNNNITPGSQRAFRVGLTARM